MKKFLVVLSLAMALTMSACWGKSDADLMKAAETAVKAKSPSVTVAVKDGVATLTGEVASQADKDAAATAAKIDGVKSVTNNITIKATPTPAPAAASGLDKMKIEDALKKAGITTVTVDVTGPKGILRGTVAKGKMADAVRVAQEAAGKPLDNQITEAAK